MSSNPSVSVPSALAALGFRQFFRAQTADLDDDLTPARVVTHAHGHYEIHDGLRSRVVRLASSLGRNASSPQDLPATGDWVAIRGDAIVHVFERSTVLVRRRSGNRVEPQVVAANADFVAVVLALTEDSEWTSRARRSANPRRLERYLLAVERSGAQPIVVLNKADRHPDPGRIARELGAVAQDAPLVVTSASEGTGVKELIRLLGPADTLALVGMSGVGKSTLLNRLAGVPVESTAPARDEDERGRHTTTARRLHQTEHGFLVLDTPGMRELGLWADEASEATAAAAFGDIATLAAECRFRDCRHEGEPGCAVEEAAGAGQLSAARLDSYRRLERELFAATREGKAAKERWAKMVAKTVRGLQKGSG